MSDIEITNALIEKADIIYEDHGIWCDDIRFSGASWCQGFGGFGLAKKNDPLDYTGWFMRRVMGTLNVSKWSSVQGSHCRIKRSGGDIIAIGHLLEDRWFDPRVEFKAIVSKGGES